MEAKSNEVDAHFSKFSMKCKRFTKPSDNWHQPYRRNNNRDYLPPGREYVAKKPIRVVKKCEACKSMREPFIGHNVRDCPNINNADCENF